MTLNDRVEEAIRALEDIGKLSEKVVADMNKELSNSEKRLLEYFWNNKRRVIMKTIPESVIVYFENEGQDEIYHGNTLRRVQHDMNGLFTKKYVVRVEQGNVVHYGLTPDGMAYLKDKHPRLFILVDRLIERTPLIAKFLIGAVGLIASIFGIIQFVDEVILK